MKMKPTKKRKTKRAVEPVVTPQPQSEPLIFAPAPTAVQQSALVSPPVYAAPQMTAMTAPPVYAAPQQTVFAQPAQMTYAAPQQTVASPMQGMVAQPMQSAFTYAAPAAQPTQAIQMATAAPVGMAPVPTAVGTPTPFYFPGQMG